MTASPAGRSEVQDRRSLAGGKGHRQIQIGECAAGTVSGKPQVTAKTTMPLSTRSYLADTLALILFFTTTGVINERWIAGMTWEQVFHARLLGGALMIPVGRPYGMWRDWVMRRATDTRASRLLWDSVALMSFQVPIYAAIIAFSGASGDGLVRGVFGAAVMMLVLGRPYGAFLNGVRRLFRLPPGGDRPMSLNE